MSHTQLTISEIASYITNFQGELKKKKPGLFEELDCEMMLSMLDETEAFLRSLQG